MQPSVFVVIDALPLTPNGKIDRKSLPRPSESAFAAAENYVAPRSQTEQAIAEIWAEVLGFSRVGVHDNFFELGGHSLLASRVMSRLRKTFEIEIPMRVIFEAPTVEKLAEKTELYRQQANLSVAPMLLPVKRPAAIPLSFSQQSLWFIAQMETDSSTYNMSESRAADGKCRSRSAASRSGKYRRAARNSADIVRLD